MSSSLAMIDTAAYYSLLVGGLVSGALLYQPLRREFFDSFGGLSVLGYVLVLVLFVAALWLIGRKLAMKM